MTVVCVKSKLNVSLSSSTTDSNYSDDILFIVSIHMLCSYIVLLPPCQFLPCQPPPPPAINLKSHAVHTAPLKRPKCPNQRGLLSHKMRLGSSSFVSSSLELTVATSSGLLLHICLIMALSLCCRFVLGQWPSFTGMEPGGALHARTVYMATGLVKEVVECENL